MTARWCAPKADGEPVGQRLGRSVGGFSTKIHVAVDALGNPLRLLLTGGQTGDATQAIALLEGFDFAAVLADRGYDTDKILAFLAQTQAEAVIPAKKIRSAKHSKFHVLPSTAISPSLTTNKFRMRSVNSLGCS